MKSQVITILLLTYFVTIGVIQPSLAQQNITLNFIGKNATTGTVQALDSIQVTGLSRSFDTTLIGVQQLVLQSPTGVDNPDVSIPNRIILSNNFGNPFSDRTSFYVLTTQPASITLEVFNTLGRNIARYMMHAVAGVHRFRFEGNAIEPGMYILTAQVGPHRSSVKMLKTDKGGSVVPQIVYEGVVPGENGVSSGPRKSGYLADDFNFVGFARGYIPEAIAAKPGHDTTYVFQLHPSNTPPEIESFVADSYGKLAGDSVLYTISSKDAEGNLSTVCIDYDGDGMFNDSTSVIGNNAVTSFKTAFTMPGTYFAKARVMDSQGLSSEKGLIKPVIVTLTETPPWITTFIADSYGKLTGDSVRYSITSKDAEGNLSQVWIDFDANGAFDDSMSVSGGDVLTSFTKVFTTPGMYLAKARVMDRNGLMGEKNLISPVIVSMKNTAPVITSFTADSFSRSTVDTIRYTISLNDAEGNLSRAWIDYDGNGVMDDSTAVSGGNALTYIKKVFTLPGSYLANARVRDIEGLVSEKSLTGPVIVTRATFSPKITGIEPTIIRIGERLAIAGEHFGAAQGSSAVHFRGGDAGLGNYFFIAGAAYTSWSENEIILSVPAGITAGGVVYVSVDGNISNEFPFTINRLPALSTADAGDIMTTSANSGGFVISDGGFQVSGRGVCWSTAHNPTTSASKTTDGLGLGIFSSSITGLHPNSTYYVRAYATNSIGTGYGDELSFTTTLGATPTLTTTIVNNISQNIAISGGVITSDGGTSVTERGVCWHTVPSPTVADNKTTDGTGIGSFISTLTGLTAGRTYYVRAYAINSAGTGYGNEHMFDTQSDISGGTVTIGSQVWMRKNLDVTTYNNGDPIPEITDEFDWMTATTGAWCFYDNNPKYGIIYGRLYNWYAVNDSRGLAPIGWHVPTDSEWTELTTFLGGETVAGGKLKESNTNHWLPPNSGSSNSSGFTALPGGMQNNGFRELQSAGYWWSSTTQIGSNSWIRRMVHSTEAVLRDYGGAFGLSVRCVKD